MQVEHSTPENESNHSKSLHVFGLKNLVIRSAVLDPALIIIRKKRKGEDSRREVQWDKEMEEV